MPTLASCDLIDRIFSPPPSSAHAEYSEGLAEAGLAATPAAQAWMKAAESALDDAQPVTLPAREAGWFDAESPAAVAVRFSPAQRWVTVRTRLAGDDATRLFLDAVRVSGDTAQSPVVLASAGDTTRMLSFRTRANEEIVVRIQPELLRGGAWEMEITASDEKPAEGEAMTGPGRE